MFGFKGKKKNNKKNNFCYVWFYYTKYERK